MSLLKKWSEWLSIKESNARKRAVRSALSGTGPELPGSYAACPSTNPTAMKVAAKSGKVKKTSDWTKFKEVHDTKPDYSFDRFLKMSQELGNDVNQLIGHGKDEEEKLDKKKKEQETKSKTDKNSGEQTDDEKTPKEREAWEKLSTIHKDRQKKIDPEKLDKSSKKEDKLDQK